MAEQVPRPAADLAAIGFAHVDDLHTDLWAGQNRLAHAHGGRGEIVFVGSRWWG